MTIENLVKIYQSYLYNLALRLVYYPQDANDLTQDVWVKIFENIDNFNQKSDFKTWAYRIMINHFLNQKRKYTQLNFDDFENTMDSIQNETLSNSYDDTEKQLLINEAKVGCMMGMLLCLTQEQRAILIIGDIFEIQSYEACEIFGITKENFRKKLSRARKKLYSFMNSYCGEANQNNSCKCALKTQSLIKNKYIDEKNIFYNETKKIKDIFQNKSDILDDTMDSIFKELYQNHPFITKKDKQLTTEILNNPQIKQIFEI